MKKTVTISKLKELSIPKSKYQNIINNLHKQKPKNEIKALLFHFALIFSFLICLIIIKDVKILIFLVISYLIINKIKIIPAPDIETHSQTVSHFDNIIKLVLDTQVILTNYNQIRNDFLFWIKTENLSEQKFCSTASRLQDICERIETQMDFILQHNLIGKNPQDLCYQQNWLNWIKRDLAQIAVEIPLI